MMKITVVCGNGLGSSLMMEMSIKKVITELGIEAEVDHLDLASVGGSVADIYVGTRDITSQLQGVNGEIVTLDNIVDKNAMKERLAAAVNTLA
ncbi:PTS sugar transporter subunit IIB [Dongshaea marina]|uniref:PTS sugar transporter subunit IIB n=1 Tax=Dongshaea marina TaxID=2047966 RepID=UPI001F38B858|nr:PTS sugar transporter subunit IIB [Dongshaea marina]